ncbi:cytochrome P450 monooxygenase [Xylariaceae sp. FL1272]|nr:cytochrome P450 monooxygenase [Xylariaceae sp. FL1272]
MANTMNTSTLSDSLVASRLGRFIMQHPESSQKYTLALFVILLPLIWATWDKWGKTQTLVPGILIVGGRDKHERIKNRKKFIHGSKDILIDGYKQAGGGFYYVPSPLGERLMVPSWVLDELKTSPVEAVDFVGTFIEMFEGKYTTMGSRSTLHPRVVKNQLNSHLPDVMPGVQDEIRNAFNDSFPDCSDWTEVPVVDRITQIVARVSSRMFGGPTLSENKEWVQASIDFAVDGFIGAQKLKKIPSVLRPVAAYFMPEISKIASHYRAAEKASIPLINQRKRTGDKASDLLYWMDEQAKGPETDPKFLASILLKVSFAAIHTSAAAPSQLIFDLCEHPEYIQPLREEYEKVLDSEGRINKQGYLQMPKLDSIMKESQRFSPLLLVTFERIIHKDLTLSNGFTIPGNTTIGVPTHAITMDPNIYPNPDKFDGFRFAKLRQEDPTMEGKGQYVASNPNSMAFGYGRHACPGRFFAAQEIKSIMVYILENYDMKFQEGQKRPQSLQVETQYLPDHSATVLFRRRKP